MSRRSRRRGGRGEVSWAGRIVVGLVVVVALGVLGAILSVRSYLHGESFRKLLSAQAGRVIGGEGQFSAFGWKGLQVRTDSFEGMAGGWLKKVRADGIEAEVGLGQFRRGVWELRGSRIRKLEAELDLTRKDGMFSQLPPPGEKARKTGGWLPDKAQVLDAEIGNMVVHAVTPYGPAELAGPRLRARSDKPMDFQGQVDGGMLQLPFADVPAVKLRKADFVWRDKSLFVTSLDAEVWEGSRLGVSGEWDSIAKVAAFKGEIREVPTQQVLDESWAKRVTGTLDLDFEGGVTPSSKHGRGSIRLSNGTLTALPVLDVLAAYADTRRFRVIPLSEARSDWKWRDGVFYLTNVVLASEGLIRVEGGLSLRGRALDGTFRLGLPPGTLSRIPGAETEVFVPGERGLLWASVRVTGTLDNPREDLSERLIAAAGARMFELLPETGETVIRYSRTLATEAAPKVVEEGMRVIEQGQGVIQDATGIMDELLGIPGIVVPENAKDADR